MNSQIAREAFRFGSPSELGGRLNDVVRVDGDVRSTRRARKCFGKKSRRASSPSFIDREANSSPVACGPGRRQSSGPGSQLSPRSSCGNAYDQLRIRSPCPCFDLKWSAPTRSSLSARRPVANGHRDLGPVLFASNFTPSSFPADEAVDVQGGRWWLAIRTPGFPGVGACQSADSFREGLRFPARQGDSTPRGQGSTIIACGLMVLGRGRSSGRLANQGKQARVLECTRSSRSTTPPVLAPPRRRPNRVVLGASATLWIVHRWRWRSRANIRWRCGSLEIKDTFRGIGEAGRVAGQYCLTARTIRQGGAGVDLILFGETLRLINAC